jgi:hypothetical protein
MKRRYSVTSISPNSPPSQQSPSHEKIQTHFQHSFSINPPELETEDQAIFDGLSENVARSWAQHYRKVLDSPFRRNTCQSEFQTLGTSIEIIDMIGRCLDMLEKQYSESVIWTIFGTESTGSMALMVLRVAVYHNTPPSPNIHTYPGNRLCIIRHLSYTGASGQN